MPLRDHFRSPVNDKHRWDAVHGQWPAEIELVSPANKDRPATRGQFISKIDALIRQDVCVSVVDIVTIFHTDLYAELLGQNDLRQRKSPPAIYAATLRGRRPKQEMTLLDLWYFPLVVGQPLPTIPIWLTPQLCIALPLESSYREVCRLLRIA